MNVRALIQPALGACDNRCVSERGSSMRQWRSRILHVALFATLVSSLFPICATTASESGRFQASALPGDTAIHVDDAVKHFISKSHAPGVAVSIVVDGKPAFARGYGEADVAHRRPVTPDTLFRLASVSKSITATGAMELWQSGKLDLDVPVQNYCREFPQKPYPITTRELLGHLGGIRHYNSGKQDLENINTKHFEDPIGGGISFFANDPLVEIPGQKFHYSTQGYTLVGCAIQGASGETYVNYITQHVFVPVGMSHSQPDDATKNIPERTAFYTVKHHRTEPADPLDSSYKIPGGGWLSSANDMAAFAVAMLNDALVTRATRDLMWTPQKATNDPSDDYGYGFGITVLDGMKVVSHSGGQQGTSTNLLIVPDKNLAVIVLINTDGVDATALSKDIMQEVLKTEAVPAAASAQ
jgi:serine beta-lactamase-like protein LACTB